MKKKKEEGEEEGEKGEEGEEEGRRKKKSRLSLISHKTQDLCFSTIIRCDKRRQTTC